MTPVAWLVFVVSALLEVGGDAMIRKGLNKTSLILIVAGFLILGCYGMTVNMVKWDFSKLLGVYVAVFAFVSILFGLLVFRESVPLPTWMGLAIIIIGGLVIQFGGAS